MGFWLSITFPLKDCPQNLAIFGLIHRKDVVKQDILLDCEIRDKSFFKRGSIAITQIDDIEVKTQFLEGRSANNYLSSFDDVYINELDLGYPDTSPSAHPVNANQMTSQYDYVALPWVNNNSGNIQNAINLKVEGATWNCSKLSFQPYMLYIVRLIFDKLGYTYDLSKWENSNYKYLLICNTLPAAWDVHNFAKALPHWTLTEFLEQLELLMNCEFNIDHAAKRVTYVFTREAITTCGTTELTRVLDDYEVSNEDASDCKYRGAVNLQYAECDHRMWKYYVNPTFIKWWKARGSLYKEVEHLYDICNLATTNGWKQVDSDKIISTGISRLYYCKDVDRYLIARATQFVKQGESEIDGENVPYGYYYVSPQLVNSFAPRIVDEDADTKELKIVPAWIDDTDAGKGQVFFLQLPDYANEKGTQPYNGFSNWDEAFANLGPETDYTIRTVEMDSGDEEEYLDKIYVGFWTGVWFFECYEHPQIDCVDFEHGWECNYTGWSLSLHSDTFNQYVEPEKIDPTKKFTFKFLADDVPNPRSLFIIYGKRYVCEKITATFTEKGMSQLMKGTFYQVAET